MFILSTFLNSEWIDCFSNLSIYWRLNVLCLISYPTKLLIFYLSCKLCCKLIRVQSIFLFTINFWGVWIHFYGHVLFRYSKPHISSMFIKFSQVILFYWREATLKTQNRSKLLLFLLFVLQIILGCLIYFKLNLLLLFSFRLLPFSTKSKLHNF